MSASNNGEADVLAATLKGEGFTWSAAASFWISLHTADPGEAGDQTTNEAAHGGYARVAVTRSTGFSVTASAGTWGFNTGTVQFPTASGGPETITHFGIGTASLGAGAGRLLFSGAVTTPLVVNTGVTPRFTAGQMRVTCD